MTTIKAWTARWINDTLRVPGRPGRAAHGDIGAGLLAAATLVGFILSRTTGLPNASDDIGNWTEPLGLASMFVEGAVVILAAYAWNLARHERHPGVHASLGLRPS